ncbi:MAG TPA: GDSL-type esterase/lipase family protein [Candidatus Nanoarchaeia archaeon]|nr:GDSL-type esterase/lipase family protein [Candidatus Nanoarchaeia archaeon]
MANRNTRRGTKTYHSGPIDDIIGCARLFTPKNIVQNYPVMKEGVKKGAKAMGDGIKYLDSVKPQFDFKVHNILAFLGANTALFYEGNQFIQDQHWNEAQISGAYLALGIPLYVLNKWILPAVYRYEKNTNLQKIADGKGSGVVGWGKTAALLTALLYFMPKTVDIISAAGSNSDAGKDKAEEVSSSQYAEDPAQNIGDKVAVTEDDKILIAGSSTLNSKHYLAELKKLVPADYVEIAEDGLSSGEIRKNLETALARKYSAVIIQAGVNDIAGGESEDTVIKNLNSMYNSAADNGAKIIALTLQPFAGYKTWDNGDLDKITAVNDYIKNQVKSGRVQCAADFYGALVDPAEPDKIKAEYTNDKLHANKLGEEKLTEILNGCLKK